MGDDGLPELRVPRDGTDGSIVCLVHGVTARLGKAVDDLGLRHSSRMPLAAACLVVTLLFIALVLCLPRSSGSSDGSLGMPQSSRFLEAAAAKTSATSLAVTPASP